MITLNVKLPTKSKIRSTGKSIKVRDNQGNYFGSELRIFFSNNPKSKFAVLDYDLPKGAGSNLRYLSILDDNKNSIYNTRAMHYSSQTVDEFLLS